MQLRKNNILEVQINRSIDCSAEVAKWNYWDHEHLDVVHGGYNEVDILYDDKNFAFGYSKIKIPVVPILYAKSPLFLVQHDDKTQFTFTIQFGVLSKTTITILPISNDSCKIIMNYKFYLDGWRRILRPILKKLIPIWNKKVWEEDYNIKIRRQKILKMGFKDFYGLPDIEERHKEHKINKLILPVPRPRNSSRDKHPLSKNFFEV